MSNGVIFKKMLKVEEKGIEKDLIRVCADYEVEVQDYDTVSEDDFMFFAEAQIKRFQNICKKGDSGKVNVYLRFYDEKKFPGVFERDLYIFVVLVSQLNFEKSPKIISNLEKEEIKNLENLYQIMMNEERKK